MSNEKISTKQCIAYAGGLFGQNALLMFLSLLMVYYTDALGVTAAAVGVVFTIGKVWDAVSDPIMGVIVDRTKTRWGKFRPYLLFAPYAIGIAGILLFCIPVNAGFGVKMVLIAVTYFLFWTLFDTIDIPYWAMIPAITKTPEERNKINAIANFGVIPGCLVGSVAASPMIIAIGGSTSNPRGYLPVAIIFVVIFIVGTNIPFFTIKEKYVVVEEKNSKKSFKDTINVIIKNRPLLLLISSIFFFMLANVVKTTGMIYYAKYVINNENVYALLNLSYLLSSTIFIIFTPMIMKKLGKRNTYIMGMIIFALSSALIFIPGITGGMMLGINFISGIGTAFYSVSYASMLADTVEYAQWNTGNRSEGIIYSSRTFITKLAAALGAALIGFALTAGQYDGKLPHQTSTAILVIKLVNSLLPAILTLLATLPMLKYNLTEEKYNEIVAELENKSQI